MTRAAEVSGLAPCLGIAQPTTDFAHSAERLGYVAMVAKALRTAHPEGPALLLLPELFLSGYQRTLSDPAAAARRDGRHLPAVSSIAREQGLWLILGAATPRSTGIANTAVVIDPNGQAVVTYDKVYLFGEAEQAAFISGRQAVVFDSPLGRTGLGVCYDVEQSAMVRLLARAGASVMLVPTANMAPYQQVARETVPRHAANASIRIAYTNHAGMDGDLDLLGESIVVDAAGQALSRLGTEPALATVSMPHDGRQPAGITRWPVQPPPPG